MSDIQSTDTSPIMDDANLDNGDDSSDEGAYSASEGSSAAPGATGDSSIDQAVKETQARLKKKYSLTVNGKQKDVELDLDNDEDVKKYLQKAYGADEKFQEAAMTRKQAEALVEMLRKDPLAVLSHPELGINVRELAQRVINQELEEMSLTPEQKRLKEMEGELTKYKEAQKKAEDAARKSETEKIEREQAMALDEEITTALSATTLPKSPYVVKRVADAMIEAINLGYDTVTPSQVMSYVEAQIKGEIADMFGSAPDKVFEEIVGRGRLDKYRKDRVAKAKASNARLPQTAAKQVLDTGAAAKPKESAEGKEKPKSEFKKLFSPF